MPPPQTWILIKSITCPAFPPEPCKSSLLCHITASRDSSRCLPAPEVSLSSERLCPDVCPHFPCSASASLLLPQVFPRHSLRHPTSKVSKSTQKRHKQRLCKLPGLAARAGPVGGWLLSGGRAAAPASSPARPPPALPETLESLQAPTRSRSRTCAPPCVVLFTFCSVPAHIRPSSCQQRMSEKQAGTRGPQPGARPSARS